MFGLVGGGGVLVGGGGVTGFPRLEGWVTTFLPTSLHPGLSLFNWNLLTAFIKCKSIAVCSLFLMYLRNTLLICLFQILSRKKLLLMLRM